MTPSIINVSGTIVALVAAIYTIPKLVRVVVWCGGLIVRTDEFSRLAPMMVRMASQFEKNGGNSFRDQLLKAVGEAQDEVVRMGQTVKRIELKVDNAAQQADKAVTASDEAVKACNDQNKVLSEIQLGVRLIPIQKDEIKHILETYVPRAEHEKWWDEQRQIKALAEANRKLIEENAAEIQKAKAG